MKFSNREFENGWGGDEQWGSDGGALGDRGGGREEERNGE